eukprot:3376703-Prymnesium_polylepis.2
MAVIHREEPASSVSALGAKLSGITLPTKSDPLQKATPARYETIQPPASSCVVSLGVSPRLLGVPMAARVASDVRTATASDGRVAGPSGSSAELAVSDRVARSGSPLAPAPEAAAVPVIASASDVCATAASPRGSGIAAARALSSAA